MVARTPLFIGLTRPTRYYGLPVGYLVVLALAVILPFMWLQTFWPFVIGLPVYVVLWFVADREPHFFEVLAVSLGTVRRTANRTYWGGDAFGP